MGLDLKELSTKKLRERKRKLNKKLKEARRKTKKRIRQGALESVKEAYKHEEMKLDRKIKKIEGEIEARKKNPEQLELFS